MNLQSRFLVQMAQTDPSEIMILENYNLTQEAEVDSDYRREFRSTLDQTKNKSFLNALSHLTNRQSKERSGKEKIGKQELVKERCKSPVDKEEEG